jgi:hypothetical protein
MRSIKIAGAVLLAVLALLFSRVIGAYVGKTTVDQFSIGETEGALAEIQRQVVRQVQPLLPMKIDEFTTLVAVTAVGPTVLYGYRVEKQSADIDVAAFKSATKSRLENQVCTSSMRKTLERGGSYRYLYYASDGVSLAEVTIALSTCANIGH